MTIILKNAPVLDVAGYFFEEQYDILIKSVSNGIKSQIEKDLYKLDKGYNNCLITYTEKINFNLANKIGCYKDLIKLYDYIYNEQSLAFLSQLFNKIGFTNSNTEITKLVNNSAELLSYLNDNDENYEAFTDLKQKLALVNVNICELVITVKFSKESDKNIYSEIISETYILK